MECPRCAGSGTCVACQGLGKVVCPACEGKGEKTTSRGTVMQCKPCGGSGQIECSPKCESCAGEGELTDKLRKEVRDKYVVRWDKGKLTTYVTQVLFALNVTLFAMQQFSSAPSKNFIYTYLTNTAQGWPGGEVWRLLTPLFLHGGWIHLGMNSYVLLRQCPMVEGLLGGPRFLALYLLSGITGNLMSWFGNCYLGDSIVAGIGASSSLFGVGGALIALHYRFGLFDRQQIQSYGSFLLIYMVFGFASQMELMGGRIDNWAHLGGFLGGFAFIWLTPRSRAR